MIPPKKPTPRKPPTRHQLADLDLLDIVERICRLYHVSFEELVGKTPDRSVSRARHALWFDIFEADESMTYSRISRLFRVDHTSVMYGISRHAKACGLLPQSRSAA